jgi:hypothetical protein
VSNNEKAAHLQIGKAHSSSDNSL